jgi:hypothetical protein
MGEWKLQTFDNYLRWEQRAAKKCAETLYSRMNGGDIKLSSYDLGARMGREKLDELLERERESGRYSLLSIYRDYYRWVIANREEIFTAGQNHALEQMVVREEDIWRTIQ